MDTTAKKTAANHYCLVAPLSYAGTAGVFTYHSNEPVQIGTIVSAPLGRRRVIGVVVAKTDQPEFSTKSLEPLPNTPAIPEYLVAAALWISDYYATGPASVWSMILPAGLSKKRRAVKSQNTANTPRVISSPPPLSHDQTVAVNAILNDSRKTHLLHGVTGSGKTRVYQELAARTLATGRSVIILVPEITLTPQIIAGFTAVFGGDVLAASHSKLTEAERHLIWSACAEAAEAKNPRIIIGPRSCLFLPAHDPGTIIIDECHESSYKQDQHPRYNTLAVAAKLATLTNSKLVLGSATPGANEIFLTRKDRIKLTKLTNRIDNKPLPQAEIVDIRNKDLFKKSRFLSDPLISAVEQTIDLGRQSLLYINRRGSASSQICGDCGYVSLCSACQLPLTFHADLMRLVCHHCGLRRAASAVCPDCGGADIKLLGAGTKRIEDEAARLWPGARLARFDRDSVSTAKDIMAMHRSLTSGEVDVIIGTQMIAKGLDLANVDVVGVINADTMLRLPDFSAAERTYQLLSQVAGRAGRGDRPGTVFIQTYCPAHPAIRAAASNQFDEFMDFELEQRQALNYPPYSHLLKLTVASADAKTATAEAAAFASRLRARPGIKVVGPAPAFHELRAGKSHWLVSITSPCRSRLVNIAANLPGNHWTADLDPVNLL